MRCENPSFQNRRPYRFESFEERLALSADSLADPLALGPRLDSAPHESFSLWCEERTDHVDQLTVAPLSLTNLSPSGVVDAAGPSLIPEHGLDGRGQTVAIIDTGIAWDHENLGQGFGVDHRVVGGWDFTEENDAVPYDDGPLGYHGTHVAGIIASDHSIHRGLAPGVDLVSLRVFNDRGLAEISWVEDALHWVHEHRHDFENPITTVNLSLGASGIMGSAADWSVLDDDLARLRDDGIFVVVAAGNRFDSASPSQLSPPAASPYVVAVSSVSEAGRFSEFSQRAAGILAAPGELIMSTVPDYVYGADGIYNDFARSSGTSMAAPYVAGASVLVRQAMERAGYRDITPASIYEHLRETADSFYDAKTEAFYPRVNLQAALEGILQIQTAEAEPETDAWGTISQFSTEVIAGNDWRQVIAGRTGALTIEATLEAGRGQTTLQIYDGERRLLSQDLSAASYQRLDVLAQQGETFYVRVLGNGQKVDIRLTNLVQLRADQWIVLGAGGDDEFTYWANSGRFRINEVEYAWNDLSSERPSSVVFQAAQGNDTAHIWGTNRDERASMWVGETRFVSGSYEVRVEGAEEVSVDGAGGRDQIAMHDSPGDDFYYGRLSSSIMRGPGFSHIARGFEQVEAVASRGHDQARLFDSPRDDVFVGSSQSSLMRSDGSSNQASGFDRVKAFSSLGADTAQFFDTRGDDRFVGKPNYAVVTGANALSGQTLVYAESFPRVEAYADSGGSDIALLYGSPGDDRFYGYPTYSMLVGPGFSYYVGQFDRVLAYAGGGEADIAKLYDSAGDDRFYGRETYSLMMGQGFHNYVASFDRVFAHASAGGRDIAKLYGSAGADTFLSTSSFLSLQSREAYFNTRGFGVVRAYGGGGVDSAVFSEIGAGEKMIGRANLARYDGALWDYRVLDFSRVSAQTLAGQEAEADMHALDYVFDQLGDWR